MKRQKTLRLKAGRSPLGLVLPRSARECPQARDARLLSPFGLTTNKCVAHAPPAMAVASWLKRFKARARASGLRIRATALASARYLRVRHSRARHGPSSIERKNHRVTSMTRL